MTDVHPFLKLFAKRSAALTSLYYLWDDWQAGRRFLKGDIASHSGTLHGSLDLEESLGYIQAVFEDYLHYSGEAALSGKVAEVGPGDNCGVALLLLDGGCESVDLVDRFYARRDLARQAAIYRELENRRPGLARRLMGADLEDEGTFPGIRRCYGEEASAETFFRAGQAYDLILSRAVLEHVRDPLLAFQRMTEALRPGGLLLHKVDLQDHGMFSVHHGELKWLETPRWVHRMMSRASGRPNRVLTHHYRQVLASLPLEVDLLVTRLAGVGGIDPHVPYEAIPAELRERSMAFVASRRRHLASEFRNVSLEDLSVAGFFMVGRKVQGASDAPELAAPPSGNRTRRAAL